MNTRDKLESLGFIMSRTKIDGFIYLSIAFSGWDEIYDTTPDFYGLQEAYRIYHVLFKRYDRALDRYVAEKTTLLTFSKTEDDDLKLYELKDKVLEEKE